MNTKIQSPKPGGGDLVEPQALLTKQQLSGYKLAEQKIEMLLKENPWIAPEQLERSFARIMAENASTRSKRAKTIEITNRVATALAPYVACNKGCSSCCHMNTMIYEHEAVHLAKVSGRRMLHLRYRPLDEVYKKGKEFNGKPCPFLVDGACSVYEDRPLVCRTHHSLFDDATWCSMDDPGANKFGPLMYDPDLLETPYRKLNAEDWRAEPWGNIGEFFPE